VVPPPAFFSALGSGTTPVHSLVVRPVVLAQDHRCAAGPLFPSVCNPSSSLLLFLLVRVTTGAAAVSAVGALQVGSGSRPRVSVCLQNRCGERHWDSSTIDLVRVCGRWVVHCSQAQQRVWIKWRWCVTHPLLLCSKQRLGPNSIGQDAFGIESRLEVFARHRR
jgi:hypothetical protein